VDEASILRGQNIPYLLHAIADYRSGERIGEDAMLERLRALSDADVQALLNYYASPMD